MVMDATQPQQPSPQSVGREFVRQYYTLLNKAPNHLHRFYNNNSSFIHGESTLVVGQKNIHNRIQQLNFHDCHAKISQVDAQATLGNGVVVQVTGELSNDGQPMRRFTQTFVLAAQSPKKYYVHNDIFRYQDMYSDEDNEGEMRSENGDDLDQSTPTTGNDGEQISQATTAIVGGETPTPLPTQLVSAGSVLPQAQAQQQQQPNAPQQHAIYYTMPTTGGRPVPVITAPQGATLPLGAQLLTAPTANITPQPVPVNAGVSQVNGVAAHDDLLAGMQQQQQQPTVAATALPATAVVAPTSAVPSGPVMPVATSANVLNASAPTTDVVGVATVPALPQNTGAGGYQQNQLMQQPLLQQQSQQHQSPPQSASAASLQSQGSSVNTCDFDDGNNGMANNEIIGATTIQATEAINIEPLVSVAPIVDDFKTINEQQLQEKYEAAKQQQNEPKTYANLFKTTSTSPSTFVNAAMQQQQQVQQQQQQQQQNSNISYQSLTSIPSATFTQSNTSPISGFNRNANSSAVDNNSNLSNQGAPLPQRNSSSRINKDYEQRRTSNAQQFGDNQQLFLGNIPHHASEDELKTIFARFGTVVELRILSKPGGKVPPGVRNPLNYGFITYDDAESVQNCLAAGAIYFPEGAHDAQKLNVEEKKPRMRDAPPRQSMGSGGGNNMNSGSGGMGSGGGQRNMSGGPQSRSLSNSGGAGGNSGGGMMRGSSAGNSMSRNSSSGGQRMGGGFNRNDNRSGSQSNGGQIRGGGNNNSQQSGGGNNSYAGRR